MKLFSIDTGLFKLDGGAMFGIVPKSIWNKTNPADPNNLCTFAMRSLLVQDGNRLILIDTGLGNKQSEHFLSHFYLHGEHTLKSSLKKHGFSPDDITDVILTHLHFDHVGGGVEYNSDHSNLSLTFKNATYWSNQKHWNSAIHPNQREKASFLKENILPIQESGQLKFIKSGLEFGSNFSFLIANGHTESQIIPHIQYKGKTVVFMADLLPSVGHIPLSYIMAYDTQPLITLVEKELFLNQSVSNDFVLFLQHDAYNECCNLKNTEKGVRLNQTFNLNEF